MEIHIGLRCVERSTGKPARVKDILASVFNPRIVVMFDCGMEAIIPYPMFAKTFCPAPKAEVSRFSEYCKPWDSAARLAEPARVIDLARYRDMRANVFVNLGGNGGAA